MMKTISCTSLVVLIVTLHSTGLTQAKQPAVTDPPGSSARKVSDVPQEKRGKKTPPPDFVAYEKAPEVLKKVEPVYPALALKDTLEGNVLLRVWVSEKGDAVETQIIKSDNTIFEEAATKAASQWKFKPAIAGGKPVAVWVTIPFRFRLSSTDKGKASEHNALIESLTSMASNVIHGRDMVEARSSVSPDAYVIDGNQYANLYAVLNGESKVCKVVDGPNTQIVIVHTHVADDMTSASMVLKEISPDGKRVRFSTVIFTHLSGGEWKIASWHVSG